jgi:hypothetical protein
VTAARSGSRLLVALVAGAAACLGGEVDRTVGLPCEFDVECAAGLVCHYDRCRSPCAVDADCSGDGGRCVLGSAGTEARVCTLPVEQACGAHGCPDLLSCGPDDVCRERCVADTDCAGGRRCREQVCVEP